MTKVIAVTAEPRARAGKGNARQTRRDGRIPAVIYGDKKDPVLISLESITFSRTLNQAGFFTRLLDVAVSGVAERCLARDVQLDPITDRPLHVDFLRVNANSTITIDVPVEFINNDKSPGLKDGGVLNVVHHTISLLAKVSSLPEKITIDLTGLKIGDSIHLEDVKLPEGVTAKSRDKAYTVATIAAPMKIEEEAPKPAAVAATAEGAAASPAAGATPAAPGAAVPAAGAAAPAKGSPAAAKTPPAKG